MLGHAHQVGVGQVGVGQVGQQVVHRHILAPAIAEGHQLVVEVAGWLSRQARKIDVFHAAAVGAIASGAGLYPRFHGFGNAVGSCRLRLGWSALYSGGDRQ